MKRLHIVWAVLVFFVLSGMPTLAQGGTIANIIQNRSDSSMDFTILQEFLDAAPAVRNRLNRSGNYTIFAPNDRAFRNVESALNLDLATIISDVEVVTAILNYHIIDETLSDQALRRRDGQVIPTRLQNAFVGIRVNSDNTIVVNNVVEVIEEDISASNGTIYVLNDVLLNRVINTLVDDKLRETASATATPNATPSSTPAPSETPQTITLAHLRLAHFSPDAPAIDMRIEAQELTLSSNLAYGEVSEFESLPQGIYNITISSDDSEAEANVAIDLDLTVLNGDFITIALMGSAQDNTLQAIPFSEDMLNLDSDESRLLVVHAVEDAPPLAFLIDDERSISSIRYGEFETVDIDAGDIDVSVVEARDNDSVIVEASDQTFAENAFYLVAIIGSIDDADLSLSQIAGDEVMRLRDETIAISEASTSEVRQGSIVSVLDDEDNFTILIAALNVAEDDVINILGNADGDPVTFLAPTDLAFRNLLTTIGYSQNRLLANRNLVTDILLYHIIEDPLQANDFRSASGTSIETELDPNQAFFVRASNSGRIFLNGSIEVIRTDIQASNGIIQVIDDVLLPQSALDILGL